MICPHCEAVSAAGLARCACGAPLELPDEPAPRPVDLSLDLDRRSRVRAGAAAVAARVGGPAEVSTLEPELPLGRDAAEPERWAGPAWTAPHAFAGEHLVEGAEIASPGPGDEAEAALQLVCAPLERRLAAWAVDGLVALAAGLAPVLLGARRLPPGADPFATVVLPGLLMVALVAFAYTATSLALMGATPGQRLLELRVAGPGGEAPGLARSAVRSALALLGLVPLGLGLWPAILSRSGRGLHDLAAGTVVVRVP